VRGFYTGCRGYCGGKRGKKKKFKKSKKFKKFKKHEVVSCKWSEA
jgi:hypothetical protein